MPNFNVSIAIRKKLTLFVTFSQLNIILWKFVTVLYNSTIYFWNVTVVHFWIIFIEMLSFLSLNNMQLVVKKKCTELMIFLKINYYTAFSNYESNAFFKYFNRPSTKGIVQFVCTFFVMYMHNSWRDRPIFILFYSRGLWLQMVSLRYQ